MKLRIHNNCIRLRLSQTEVDQIAKGNPIHEKLEFPSEIGTLFFYALVPNPDIDAVLATFANNEILIQVPDRELIEWAKSDRVGIHESIKTTAESNLRVDVEKDFQCLHKRPGEDESDNFPHPAA
jgi:hypothetical protein